MSILSWHCNLCSCSNIASDFSTVFSIESNNGPIIKGYYKERERERDRQTDRQTETQRKREGGRERQTEMFNSYLLLLLTVVWRCLTVATIFFVLRGTLVYTRRIESFGILKENRLILNTRGMDY